MSAQQTSSPPTPPTNGQQLIPSEAVVRSRLGTLYREARLLRRLLKLSRDAAASPTAATTQSAEVLS